MAIGDAARQAGYGVVPEEGEDGKVRYGAREINRTRDQLAGVSSRVPANKTAMRDLLGIRIGTAAPTGGVDGDIYLQVV